MQSGALNSPRKIEGTHLLWIYLNHYPQPLQFSFSVGGLLPPPPSATAHTPSYTLLDQNRPNSSEPQRNSEMISAVLRYRLLQLLLKSRVHQGICLRFLKCPLISVSFLKFTDGSGACRLSFERVSQKRFNPFIRRRCFGQDSTGKRSIALNASWTPP